MDISTDVIAQFFKRTDALQNFGSAEATRECCSFLFCNRYLSLCHIIVRPKNVGPPRKQCLYQRGTPFQIQALRDCLVVFFAFCQPPAVGCIFVAGLFPFQSFVSLEFYLFPHGPDEIENEIWERLSSRFPILAKTSNIEQRTSNH